MLHEVTEDGGVGFCHAAVPAILPPGYHGPLVVALDSNILIDLREHGNELLNGEASNDGLAYEDELLALGTLIDIWLLRDIRFIVTPRSRTDAKRLTDRFLATRGPAIDALAESLAFQYGDWTVPVPSDFDELDVRGSVDGLPDGADRELVGEAQAVGAHVFLTRDREILDRAVIRGQPLAIMAPAALADEMVRAGVELFAGGICHSEACPYRGLSVPAPDTGKWNGLLSIFEGE